MRPASIRASGSHTFRAINIYKGDHDEYLGMWNNTGKKRPAFAVEPLPGQESVWDYPRPPALVDFTLPVEVRYGEHIIARSDRCKRVLETASPPTIYIPPDDIMPGALIRVAGNSFCEWKGAAVYLGLADAPDSPAVAWTYPEPGAAFAPIRDWVCFYPGRIECYIADERVRPQEGGFYGGWVTDSIAGPWKGSPNTGGW
jgi:uncharacterized protein (DUF427 family)